MRMINTEYSQQMSGEIATRQSKVGGSAKIVFAILTGMVKDKIGYPIREYATNAWEVSPKGKPFEVHLPTRWNPVYRIRDYGPGLGHSFMMNRFPKLGDSTKDGSDNAVGGWGFGGKSGLAYLMRQDGAGTFTVVSRHRGFRRTYVIGLSDQGMIQITCLEETQVDEPSGLEISFSVRTSDIETFGYRASEILWSFDPAPVISPKPSWPEPKIIAKGDGWTRYDRHSVPWDGPQVRMGPVMYPIDLNMVEHDHFVERQDCILFDAQIGTVSVSSSRESLAYDDKTKETLSALLSRYADLYVETIQAEINTAQTYFEACKTADEKASSLGTVRAEIVKGRLAWCQIPIRRYVVEYDNKSIASANPPVKTSLVSENRTWVDRFDRIAINTSTAAGAIIAVEHTPYRSAERMLAAGLVGKRILWVRCKKPELQGFLLSIGNPDYILLDTVKLDPMVRGPSGGTRDKNVRMRPTLKVETESLYGTVEERKTPVDLSAGGLYVDRVSHGRNSKWFELGTGYQPKREYDFKSFLRQMVEMKIIDEDLQILIPDPKDTLNDDWYPAGEYLEMKLRDRFDPKQVTPHLGFSRNDLPSRVRHIVEKEIDLSNAPAELTQLAAEVRILLAGLKKDRVENEHDKINGLLKQLTGKGEERKEDDPTDGLDDRWQQFAKDHPIFVELTNNLEYAYNDGMRKLKSNVEVYFNLVNNQK